MTLIFFIYPVPKGSEENQFAPFRVGVNKLIFNDTVILGIKTDNQKDQ